MPPTTLPFPLGRRVEHDARSRQPQFAARKATTLINKHWRRYGETLDQGALGSCTGNAITHARNCVPLRQARPLLHEPDAVRVYSRATQLDVWDGAYPPDDTGSSGLAACKAAREFGWIDAYRHAFGLDEALAALVYSPVIIGVPWYEGMFAPDAKGFVWPDGGVAGGHEVCVRGLSVTYRTVRCVNSWGAGWGPLGGEFKMTWDVFGRLLSEDGDCTVPTVTYRAG